MLKSHFIEDIFVEFIEFTQKNTVTLQKQDQSAALNFYNIILSQKALTSAQGSYLIKILEKNKYLCASRGFDYKIYLEDPKWKKPFRVLDLTKKIWVETKEDGEIIVCLKFPYQLKDEFQKKFSEKENQYVGMWDNERNCRVIPFYDANLIALHDFSNEYQFEIDETFILALGQVEEIWQNDEQVIPYCGKFRDEVALANVCQDAADYFNSNRSKNYNDDIFLAKSMGICLIDTPKNDLEKICSSSSNHFWLKSTQRFLSLCDSISGKIAIVLDRSGNAENWVKNFAEEVKIYGMDPNLIKVCFRKDKATDKGFNQWIKDIGFGGPTESGKIFIFDTKPAKWIFKEENMVKILAVDDLLPSHTHVTREWIATHHCVIMLGDVKPTHRKDYKIVEL